MVKQLYQQPCSALWNGEMSQYCLQVSAFACNHLNSLVSCLLWTEKGNLHAVTRLPRRHRPKLKILTKKLLEQVIESAGDVMEGWQTLSKIEALCAVRSISTPISAVL